MAARWRALVALVPVLFCIFDGLPSAAAKSDNNAEAPLLQLEKRWVQAEAVPDALESILADDFIHVLPIGFITKREQLSYMRSHLFDRAWHTR